MQARIRKANDVIIVQLHGKISYESLDGFQNLCRKDLQARKVVFDLENLSFVGSSGLTNFISILQDLQRTPNLSLRFCSVSREFTKLFSTTSSDFQNQSFFENEVTALRSFEAPAVVTTNLEASFQDPIHGLEVKES